MNKLSILSANSMHACMCMCMRVAVRADAGPMLS
jgi:hypothetical protein